MCLYQLISLLNMVFQKEKKKGYDTDTQIFKMKNFKRFTQIHHNIKSSLFQWISSFHLNYFAYTDKLIMAKKNENHVSWALLILL